jgi:leucyl aminopeptidase (aminopeptidase T)
MTDPRYTKLARLLVEYSTALRKGDRVLLDMIEVPDEFTVELIRAVRAAAPHRWSKSAMDVSPGKSCARPTKSIRASSAISNCTE